MRLLKSSTVNCVVEMGNGVHADVIITEVTVVCKYSGHLFFV